MPGVTVFTLFMAARIFFKVWKDADSSAYAIPVAIVVLDFNHSNGCYYTLLLGIKRNK
jgi:hypothetical protein